MLQPLIYACGGSDESEEVEETIVAVEVVVEVTNPAENTLAINIAEQNKIELEATSTLGSITMEGDFDFEILRMVHVDLHYPTVQYQEKISIYSAIEPTSNTPINLLEQDIIYQSNRYKTMLATPATINSLMVVRNDDFSTLVTVEINSNDLLTHTFQE